MDSIATDASAASWLHHTCAPKTFPPLRFADASSSNHDSSTAGVFGKGTDYVHHGMTATFTTPNGTTAGEWLCTTVITSGRRTAPVDNAGIHG
ncbi:hypothetical protein [Nonomuraea jabiensis]|uniref:hypothetical protein n=1 Tax=Nonomuraea jabiensis TaxID=882448 RepID=UPI003D765DF5